jgi:hypothetical protein
MERMRSRFTTRSAEKKPAMPHILKGSPNTLACRVGFRKVWGGGAGRKILGDDWRKGMGFCNGKKGAVWRVCIPRINNSAERREIEAFLGEPGWDFSRLDWEGGGMGGRRVTAGVSGV